MPGVWTDTGRENMKPTKAVERMLKSQIEWLTLEREISRLRRLRCIEAIKDNPVTGDGGQAPCWLSECDIADMCAPCQQRALSNIGILRKQRGNARRRMVYAFEAYTKAGAASGR